MTKRFRQATPSDAATVRDITRAAYAKWVDVIGREPKPMTANYEQAVINHVIDLLEEEAKPIALIEIIPKASHLLIENIAVMPRPVRRGHRRAVAGPCRNHRAVTAGERAAIVY
jgi:hypothetical protein